MERNDYQMPNVSSFWNIHEYQIPHVPNRKKKISKYLWKLSQAFLNVKGSRVLEKI